VVASSTAKAWTPEALTISMVAWSAASAGASAVAQAEAAMNSATAAKRRDGGVRAAAHRAISAVSAR